MCKGMYFFLITQAITAFFVRNIASAGCNHSSCNPYIIIICIYYWVR